MSKGFDSISDCTSHGVQIKSSGYSFVGRYYFSGISHVKTKLSYKEAKHLSDLGIYLVAVFENASNHKEYFSLVQGTLDGASAFSCAENTIKQPLGTPIYFTVDYDASEQDLTQRIIPYFKGIRQSKGEYLVGVYGSGFICRRLKELGLVHFTWLAQSGGWSESKTYSDWNINQGNTTTLFGMDIDLDQSNNNAGGFKVV